MIDVGMGARTVPDSALGLVGMAEYDGCVHGVNGDCMSISMAQPVRAVVRIPHGRSPYV